MNAGIGGVQVAMILFGPPMTPMQSVCYAAYGSASAIIASTRTATLLENWPINSFPSDVNKINERALGFYDSTVIDFSSIGQIHNQGLECFKIANCRVENSPVSRNLFYNFVDTSTLLNNKATLCFGKQKLVENSEELFNNGYYSVDIDFNSQNIQIKYDSILNQNPYAREAIEIIKNLSLSMWSYYKNNDIELAEQHLKSEVNKINSNEYGLDIINYTFAVTMANIFVYSYCYWTYKP